MGKAFEVFFSYAHTDNDGGWIDLFSAAVARDSGRLTGQAPEYFIDRESLITADIWDARIKSALDSSQLLLAIISPAYVRSEWCRREWDILVERESTLRSEGLLDDEKGIIFPILLYPLDRGVFDDEQSRFARRISERQWLDVSSQLDGTPLRSDQIRRLAENLIDASAELEQRARHSAAATVNVASSLTIRDPEMAIDWSATLSPTAMSLDAAQRYVAQLEIGGSMGWRLPTKAELESIVEPGALIDDPKASPFPLREPFNSQRAGYLHSGTPVNYPGGGTYVMNVRNGHIFNGKGYEAFARAVHAVPE